jgi:hypothetical protein
MPDMNLQNFFASLVRPEADNRILICYDSMSSDAVVGSQACAGKAIIDAWDIPKRNDGSSGWVGWSTTGPRFTTNASKFYVTGGSGGNAGWTVAGGKKPGGTSTGTATCGGAASGGETGIMPHCYCDMNIATGAARTAYGAEPDTFASGGKPMFLYSMLNAEFGAGSTLTQLGVRGADPFDQKQTHTRLIWVNNAAGPNDMTLQAIRQAHDQGTWTTNNTLLIGSKTTLNMAGSGLASVDVDNQAGPGAPGIIMGNPVAPAGATPLRMYVAGIRTFRSSGGNPIAGTSMCVFAVPASYDVQHASLLGVTGMLSGLAANEVGPDPYCPAATAREYLRLMSGRGTGNDYPNKIIIYFGHNRTFAENTELIAGTSAIMTAALNAIMDQHNANADALSSPRPDFLLVRAAKFYDNYAPLSDGVKIHTNIGRTAQAICAARGSKCSYIDLREYTDDGSSLDTYMPYCRALAISSPGSGSGPIAGADGVHNTHAGAEYLWRIVWERGMASLGIDTRAQFAGPLRKAPKPWIRGRGWM